ncbi:MAG TPA: DUF924 family protein [Gammaproteobacteria bacterium]|nr:DUF924 family protein [Gammaproteobacteria bacterium]
MQAKDVVSFWFDELSPKQQFAKDEKLDALIQQRFGGTHQIASRGELFEWRDTPEGRLAEIIVLDQFSRNLFRDRRQAFACDGMALVLAQEAIHAGADQSLPATRKAFLYMPYMHSESPRIHQLAVQLFSQPGMEFNLKFELKHKAIIDRFGRFPHRNVALGRVSTAEETEFLSRSDSSF